jgi:hypothetical protein
MLKSEKVSSTVKRHSYIERGVLSQRYLFDLAIVIFDNSRPRPQHVLIAKDGETRIWH